MYKNPHPPPTSSSSHIDASHPFPLTVLSFNFSYEGLQLFSSLWRSWQTQAAVRHHFSRCLLGWWVGCPEGWGGKKHLVCPSFHAWWLRWEGTVEQWCLGEKTEREGDLVKFVYIKFLFSWKIKSLVIWKKKPSWYAAIKNYYSIS